MLRFGIDARLFGPEQKGLGRYVEHALVSLDGVTDVQPVVFCLPQAVERVRNIVRRAEIVPIDVRWYTVREQAILPLLIHRHRIDVMHYPHFNVPLWAAPPFVLTIHDLLLREYPSTRASLLGPLHFYAKRVAWYAVLKSALRRAYCIMTPSESVARAIRGHYPDVTSDRMVVTPLGADACDGCIPAPESILASRGITGTYFLYVGNVYPHKNIAWLISAFQVYHFRHPGSQLVLVGAPDPFQRALNEGVERQNLSDAVVFWGTASDAELARLYRSCTAYLFPTLSEGFGIPALEAMAAGAPVICSDIPVLREVLGDAPYYFSPNDTSGILIAMERVLQQDPSAAATCRERGVACARRYSWSAMHEKTGQVYQSLINAFEEKRHQCFNPEPR